MGKNRSSRRKYLPQAEHDFLTRAPSEARAAGIAARDLMLKSQHSYPLDRFGRIAPSFVRISMDFRALDESAQVEQLGNI